MRIKLVVFFLVALLYQMPKRVMAHAGGAIPADLWRHWNFDALLLIGLIASTYLYVRGATTYPVERWRTAIFLAAMVALFVALISPLEALSDSLFSAHMVQHLLLILVAAPMLVLSRPLASLLRGLPPTWRKRVGNSAHHPMLQSAWARLTGLMTVLALHLVALWFWHLPALYSVALANKAVHILEHASFFLTTALYWWMIVNREHFGGRVLSVFIVMMASGLLGALMTFASTAWYADHALSVQPWGLTPLADQQLAGLFMWIPAGIVYAVVAAMLLAAWLHAVEQRTLKRERRFIREMSDG